MVGATGIPRTAQGCRLWGTRNDLIALYLSNLLVVEPWHTVNVCDVDFVIPTVNKKTNRTRRLFFIYGRGDRNRTCDPLHPMQVLYQAELRPDVRIFIQCKYSTRLSYAPTYAYLYNYHELKASIYFMLARIGKKLLVFAYQ